MKFRRLGNSTSSIVCRPEQKSFQRALECRSRMQRQSGGCSYTLALDRQSTCRQAGTLDSLSNRQPMELPECRRNVVT